jgi:hypothetical protein
MLYLTNDLANARYALAIFCFLSEIVFTVATIYERHQFRDISSEHSVYAARRRAIVNQTFIMSYQLLFMVTATISAFAPPLQTWRLVSGMAINIVPEIHSGYLWLSRHSGDSINRQIRKQSKDNTSQGGT